MLFMFTEKVVLKPNDVSVFTTLTINGRLFACPREQFDSLVGVDGLLRAVRAIRKTCLQLNFATALNKVPKNNVENAWALTFVALTREASGVRLRCFML